ncbi:MAG: hypothetical protein EBV27_05915 [Actinobacteria bacterium]|jgi:hypothetical protein|nr:hypothetical protein [Actinomycetota bacterium]
MGKLEAKALFYIELNGGFVRLSLRPILKKAPLCETKGLFLWCIITYYPTTVIVHEFVVDATFS